MFVILYIVYILFIFYQYPGYIGIAADTGKYGYSRTDDLQTSGRRYPAECGRKEIGAINRKWCSDAG